jgi:hypothetical protein
MSISTKLIEGCRCVAAYDHNFARGVLLVQLMFGLAGVSLVTNHVEASQIAAPFPEADLCNYKRRRCNGRMPETKSIDDRQVVVCVQCHDHFWLNDNPSSVGSNKPHQETIEDDDNRSANSYKSSSFFNLPEQFKPFFSIMCPMRSKSITKLDPELRYGIVSLQSSILFAKSKSHGGHS